MDFSFIPPFFHLLVTYTPEQWLELLRTIHLFINPDSDCDTAPYRFRPPEPRPVNPKIPRLAGKSQSESSIEELDAVPQFGRRVTSVNPQLYENGQSPAVMVDAASSVHGGHYDQRYISVGVAKQNMSHIVPMKGRNFSPVIAQNTVMQMQSPNAQTQYVMAAGAHGTPLRTQQVVVQTASPRGQVVYQVAPSSHQASLIRQVTPDKTKGNTQLLIVNHGSPGRIPGVVSTPQPTLATLKRPVRSSRLRKEVETIALDDDDETCGAKASSSSSSGEHGENGVGNNGNGEPSEKKARIDESIRDEVLLVFPPGETGAVSCEYL
ncbi:unnamed protein product [Strongylus vulgaris]|uniref:Uncharacterized protein n=1 Tax=Strongylus vulgaris TaxID=40348 RepID=A0A3P7KMU0_STRVU|nr:unnamed protein product [Strongylus vulgaris]